MSNADNNKTRAERPAKKVPKGDYEVGYCRPDPKAQFKPGNNANPKGRPRGSRNQKVLVTDIFLEPIPVREGNTTKMMPKIAALLTQTLNDGLKGDHKSRLASISIAQLNGILTPEPKEEIEENVSERDKMILEDFKRRQGASRSALATEAPSQPSSVPAEENPRPDAAQSGAAPLPKLTRPVLPINGAYRSAPATEAPTQPSSVPDDQNSRPDTLPKLTRPVPPINGADRCAPATEAPAQPSSVPAEDSSQPDASPSGAAPLPKLTRPVYVVRSPQITEKYQNGTMVIIRNETGDE